MTKSHYSDFVALQSKKGIHIVAFPCNQFGKQEPGTPADIKKFARRRGLKVNTPDSQFWLMNKIDVNGPNTHPVYKWLKQNSQDFDIKWNFDTKFVVRCDDTVGTCNVSRHDGGMLPSSLISKEEL